MRPHHLFAFSPALALLACSSDPPAAGAPDFDADDASVTRPMAAPVSPLFIGTGGFGYGAGSAFVGAAAPNGMVKLGPDTSGPWGTINFLHFSGYWYGDDTVLGFSHMHLHGTGAQDYGVLGVMPVLAFDASKTNAKGYATKFDKSSESPAPGHYKVTLDGGIGVDLVATAHAAHHKYTFPAGATSGHVVIDLDHHLGDASVSMQVLDLDAANKTLRGSFRSLGGMSKGFGGIEIYFAMRTASAWSGSVVWQNGAPPAAGTHAEGTQVGAELDFDLTKSPGPVELQVGLSLVSLAAAQANLDAEMPAFAFDQEAAATAGAWSAATGAITFTGASPAQQAMLDAALYHLFLMPTIYSDVDGSYVGLDGKVAKASYHYCSDLSLWDTYRTLNPLYDLIAPERALDVAASLTAMAKAGGYFPKWPIGSGEAGTMLGSSAEVVLADAVVKGVTGFDAEAAYQMARAAATDPSAPAASRGGRDAVVSYMQLGYVPASGETSVSKTLEYVEDDLALASLARALGHTQDADALTSRAHGYQKLYDPSSGFFWSKAEDGSWATVHGDPSVGTDEFAEANPWQSLWGPWQDTGAFLALLGGREQVVRRLESFFVQGKADYDATTWTSSLSAGSRRNYYWGGNEPDIQAPYIFALAGRPDLTQKWLRWIEGEVYGPGADGLPGNDDGGTMSAWLVWSALGFYPLAGSDAYVLGAPMVPHAELHLAGGTFTIDAPGVSDDDPYVQSVTLNGAPLTSPVLHHADLRAGGSLAFVMGPKPSAWGR